MSFVINGRKIEANAAPYIIAELSANHLGDIEKAKSIIAEAQVRGADAVKLQTYTPDTMTIDCDKDDFIIKGGLWDGYKLYDLYKEAQTPFEWQRELFDYAKGLGITCFSTPFDETAVDLLEEINVPAYKVASFEANDLPLVRYIGSTKRPMIISTGMANLLEIEEVVQAARDGGCQDIVLLHCLSSYPAPVEQSNLLTIPDMKKRFGVNIGLSDHTLSNVAAIAATALGAVMIEKHFTLNRNDGGADSAFSIEPVELEALCRDTRAAKSSLGEAGYETKPAEESSLIFRRSLYFVRAVEKGEAITSAHVRRIRPGYGISPKYEADVIGKRATRNIEAGTAVNWDLIND